MCCSDGNTTYLCINLNFILFLLHKKHIFRLNFFFLSLLAHLKYHLYDLISIVAVEKSEWQQLIRKYNKNF